MLLLKLNFQSTTLLLLEAQLVSPLPTPGNLSLPLLTIELHFFQVQDSPRKHIVKQRAKEKGGASLNIYTGEVVPVRENGIPLQLPSSLMGPLPLRAGEMPKCWRRSLQLHKDSFCPHLTSNVYPVSLNLTPELL